MRILSVALLKVCGLKVIILYHLPIKQKGIHMAESAQEIKLIIANNIRKYRSQLGLSQEELADICDLHRTYIGSVERCERNVTLNTLCVLSNALKIKVVDLLTNHG